MPTGRRLLNYSEPLHELNELVVARQGQTWLGYCLLLPLCLGLVWPWCTHTCKGIFIKH